MCETERERESLTLNHLTCKSLHKELTRFHVSMTVTLVIPRCDALYVCVMVVSAPFLCGGF